ncbi:vacuolar protein-sorting-associated protein 25-like [Homarus americanus]|uniref:Vacuolar protein-sorting-associated protein 25 n=1 Tax=Homarus americanus TaxID=6706 RepID=A0A8J5K6L9_HOMAM|nr:vacuolar protein-sorting-associated protein 25-like [Homarus americanus]KAG7170491.1 Vacuolar protein-sorting-associated protein 25-like [Homarus americanus]
MAEFEWPWQYSFPPFFTLQPNADVRRTQLDSWCALVVSWGKSNSVSQIDVTEASSLPVFKNNAISRALPVDGIKVVLDELAKRGNLEWTDKTRRRGYLLWRSPSEWGQQIYSWAQSTSRINNVCTLYEINQGDESADQEFHGLDGDILLKALKTLEVTGKAELMDFGDNQGIKFL